MVFPKNENLQSESLQLNNLILLLNISFPRMKLKLFHFQMMKMNLIYLMKYLNHLDRLAQTTMMMVSIVDV